MYRLRCTVSGGLELFAEQEVSQVLSCNNFDNTPINKNHKPISIHWHHRGHTGSQLDIIFPENTNFSLEVKDSLWKQYLSLMVHKLRYIDHVAMEVISIEIPALNDKDDNLLEWISQQSQQLALQKLQEAIQAWTVWQPRLDKTLSTRNELEGILLPFPSKEKDSPSDDPCDDITATTARTTDFSVNTIYTHPAVAKVVVQTFVELVRKELAKDEWKHDGPGTREDTKDLATTNCSSSQQSQKHHDNLLWLDAGSGCGSLLQEFPPNTVAIGVDLDPQHESIYQYDFLEVTRDWLQQHILLKRSDDSILDTTVTSAITATLCIISNPPFVEGSRGDYSIIAKFMQHAAQTLKARFMGLIVPIKFSHVWRSFFFDNDPIKLLYRMNLPDYAFYDPSTLISKNARCHFLFFDLQSWTKSIVVGDDNSSSHTLQREQQQQQRDADTDENIPSDHPNNPPIHVEAQRDKGAFPSISTAALKTAVVRGLGHAGVALGSSKISPLTLRAKLTKSFSQQQQSVAATGTLELFLDLNPRRPLSLVNSGSAQVPHHSLGWMAKSVNPPVAAAMASLARMGKAPPLPPVQETTTTGTTRHSQKQQPSATRSDAGLTINLMCGEGTIEYESIATSSNSTDANGPATIGFQIVGDKNPEAVHQVASQLRAFQSKQSSSQSPAPAPILFDFVVWDAQHLPLRDGIVDAVLADLPFAGSNKKVHQEPGSSGDKQAKKKDKVSNPQGSTTSPLSLSYPRIMAETARVQVPSLGRVVVVSPDTNSLVHAIKMFSGHFKDLWQTKVNIGGLPGKMALLQRKASCWKDMSVTVKDATIDRSSEIYELARETCKPFYLNDVLEIQQQTDDNHTTTTTTMKQPSLIRSVYKRDDYHHAGGTISQCYRFCFHPLVTNTQAKMLEKVIRLQLETSPVPGIEM